jgi:tRNA(His) 5'-end guanylyltransferase
MNTALLERLRGFQIPPAAIITSGNHVVARLLGIDFEGILDSPDFGFARPFDPRFGKMMVRTASHLLGGDACGRFGFAESMEMSILLDHRSVAARWKDATDLQSYLVALAASKMSLQVEDEALFSCKLYSFTKPDLVIAYFLWRRQEASLAVLDRYSTFVLSKDNASPDTVAKLLEGLGPLEKEEILRQHGIEYAAIPAWQRSGTAVYLGEEDGRVAVETNLPPESGYGSYLQQYMD